MSDSSASSRDSTDQPIASRWPGASVSTHPSVEANNNDRITTTPAGYREPLSQSTDRSGSPLMDDRASKEDEPETEGQLQSRLYKLGGRKGKEPHRVSKVFPSISCAEDRHQDEETLGSGRYAEQDADPTRRTARDEFPGLSGSARDQARPSYSDSEKAEHKKRKLLPSGDISKDEETDYRSEKRRLVLPAAVPAASSGQKNASGRIVSERHGGSSVALLAKDRPVADKVAAPRPATASGSDGSGGRDTKSPRTWSIPSLSEGQARKLSQPRPLAQTSGVPSRPAAVELTSTPASAGQTGRQSAAVSREKSPAAHENPGPGSTVQSERSKTGSVGIGRGPSRAIEGLMKSVKARKAREMLQATRRATNPVTIMRNSTPPGTLLDSQEAAAVISARSRMQQAAQERGRDNHRQALMEDSGHSHSTAEAWRNRWKSSQSLVDDLGSKISQDRAVAQRSQAAALQAEASASPAQQAQERLAILKVEKAVLENDAKHIEKQLMLERRAWEADEIQLADRLQRLNSEADELRLMLHEADRMRRRLQESLSDERHLKERAILLATDGLDAGTGAPPHAAAATELTMNGR